MRHPLLETDFSEDKIDWYSGIVWKDNEFSTLLVKNCGADFFEDCFVGDREVEAFDLLITYQASLKNREINIIGTIIIEDGFITPESNFPEYYAMSKGWERFLRFIWNRVYAD